MSANGNGHHISPWGDLAERMANATPPTLTVAEARAGRANLLLGRSHELLGPNRIGRHLESERTLLRHQITQFLQSSSAEPVERSGRKGVPHRSGRSMGGTEE